MGTPEPPTDREQALNLRWLLEYHRHDDVLFDRRLYSLLVSQAFLVAAFTQLRERPYFLLALTVCFAGLAIACVFYGILARAAKAIDWSNDEIREAETKEPDLRKRIYTKRDAKIERTPGVTKRLARRVPSILIGLWIVLGVLLSGKHALDCSKYYPCLWGGSSVTIRTAGPIP